MGFRMAYCFATFAVILIIYVVICPVNGQCTIMQSCDNRDQLLSIVDEILQLRDELFHRLDKQDRSIYELKGSFEELKSQRRTLNMSFQAADRCPLEQDICREQLRSVFNESFQEIKNQHVAIMTSLQAVDRRLEKHDISIRNEIQKSQTFANGNCDPVSDVCDCSDTKANGQNTSGVYVVCVGQHLSRTCTSAFCDMEAAIGASLVFQRRKDGSVDFNRTWAEYREGFGNPDGEFWLGNEMLYLLTSKRNYKLRVDLEDWEGAKRYAEYASFSINSSDDNYRLTVSGYSGTAGDSMSYYNGKQFTTIDVDNDEDSGYNCARDHGGAWWHRVCGHSALNGKYYQRYDTVITYSGIHWYYFKYSFTYSLKATEMKLVPVA